jgi:Protein of unknown function (Hypoth_ymh)
MTEGPNAEGPPIRRGGFMSRQHVATQTVRIIHAEGTEDEVVHEEVARIQPKSGLFDVQAPIHEGDIVEVPDPQGGPDVRERRVAAVVRVNDSGPKILQHTQVIWGKASEPRVVAPVRVLTFEDLHEHVQTAAAPLLASGRYEDAVREAFALLEVRVRTLSDQTGAGPDPAQEVRDAILAIFGGVIPALGATDARASVGGPRPQQALEQLALASLLHRRLDVVEQRGG